MSKFKDNVPGFPGYHVTKDGDVYSMKCRLALEISHNGWQTTSIGNLDLEDLKRIRKVIRKAIREHENNKPV